MNSPGNGVIRKDVYVLKSELVTHHYEEEAIKGVSGLYSFTKLWN